MRYLILVYCSTNEQGIFFLHIAVQMNEVSSFCILQYKRMRYLLSVDCSTNERDIFLLYVHCGKFVISLVYLYCSLVCSFAHVMNLFILVIFVYCSRHDTFAVMFTHNTVSVSVPQC